MPASPGIVRSVFAALALIALVVGTLVSGSKTEAQNSQTIYFAYSNYSYSTANLVRLDTSDCTTTQVSSIGPYIKGLTSIGNTLYLSRSNPVEIRSVDTSDGSTSLTTTTTNAGHLASIGTTMYMADDLNSRVVSVDLDDGTLTTVASFSSYSGYLYYMLAHGGYLYLDRGNNLLRVDPSTGTVTDLGSINQDASPARVGDTIHAISNSGYCGTISDLGTDTVTYSNNQASVLSGFATVRAIAVYPGYVPTTCTTSLAPATSLGTLGNTSGSQIVHSATLVRGVDEIACGNEATAYFQFIVTEGGGVGFFMEGVDATYHVLASSSYSADLADCGGGADTCENTEPDDFGGVFPVTGGSATYTFFVEGGFGDDADYILIVERLIPSFVEALTTNDSIISSWDVGAPSEFLEMRVDYRESTASNWTLGTTYAGPGAGDNVVENTTEDLDIGDYELRGVFRQAPDSQGGTGLASTFPQVWGLPPGAMAIEAEWVEDLEVYRYSVIATWQFPQVRFTDWDDELVDWSFLLRYNGTEIDVGQTRRAVFFVDEPGGLKVDVRVRFACPDSSTDTDECQLRIRGWVSSYAGDDDHDYFVVPQGVTILTPRSDAASVYIDPDPRVVETELVDEVAIPPVVDAISGFLAIAGVAPESRRPEVWAFFLCLMGGLAIGGGLGFVTSAAGRTSASLFAGAFIFFLWWSLLGPEWFGIPPFFAYGTIAAPILAGGILVLGRAKL